MLKRRLLTTWWSKFQKQSTHQISNIVKKTHEEEYESAKIRNIGILAHIDAGKTTTTERMLYYSGLIKHMGEVHHGNTTTDYMEQERQRGITITSAAATFEWKNHRINLIDTPGHVDFTMEVEQTLRVLDGAVVILDGSAGVEAQTLTVCRQADKYSIPRIIYVNKMDRPDANFDASLKSIESKLDVKALPTQFPIKENGILEGIVDVVTLEKLIFDKKTIGTKFTRTKLSESEDKSLWEIAFQKRRDLADKLSNMDDKLADIIIDQESLDSISPQLLLDSLYRTTISRMGVPVLLGSSYKNMGVQPLMDGILLYLPSPDRSIYLKYYQSFNKHLSAKVFKVVHDKQKGPITFFRIYTGSMNKGDIVYNVHKKISEHVSKLYIACADDYENVSHISHGNIAAVTGLKYSTTGDLFTSSIGTVNRAKKILQTQKDINPEDVENFFASNLKILEPVFFCSIEAPSFGSQAALETALQKLEREDPSLRVTYDNENNQIILAGMGELHIEIIKERINSEYNIDAQLGPLQIAYRETIINSVKDTFNFEHKVDNSNQTVMVTISLIPNYHGSQTLLLDRTPDCIKNIDAILPKMMKAITNGVTSVLQHGPKLGYPVTNMGIKLHWLEYGSGTFPMSVTAAISQSIRKLMQKSTVVLMEPVMLLEVVVPDVYSTVVMADLSKRRVEIQDIDVREKNKVIRCFVPLAELLQYSTTLRILSSGYATFSLQFNRYELMDAISEAKAVKKTTGFY